MNETCEATSEKRDAARRDAEIVRRCLAGDSRGWEELYDLCHPRLLEAISYLLGKSGRDASLVDEIAARVWYAVVRDEGRLLARFDSERNCRLGVFFVGLARNELMRYLRAESRRRSREFAGGFRLFSASRLSERQLALMMNEFARTLNPAERSFLENVLLAPPDQEDAAAEQSLSRSNFWQRRHRIRHKLQVFLGEA